MTEAISLFGSVCSIVGLFLTVYVAKSVRRIRASYTRQGLIPTFLSRLRGALKNLDHAIASKDEGSLKTELQKCKSILKSVSAHSRDSSSIKATIFAIDDLSTKKGMLLFSSARDVRDKMAGEVETLTLMKSENQWRRPDG